MTAQTGKLTETERLLKSGILPKGVDDLLRVGANSDGTVWYKDTVTCVCYRIAEVDGALVVKETRELKKTREHKAKTTTIECVDCGEERTIATQDAFQVKRCEDCQRKHRNKKRTERARSKRLEKRNTRDLEQLNKVSE